VSALAGVRAYVAAALSGVDVSVHTYPPATVSPPCVVLVPGSPYLDPGTGWGSATVALDVRIMVNSAAGATSAQRMDDLIDTVVAALLAAQVQVQSVPPPTADPDSSTLVVDIPTTTVWKDE